MCKYLIVVLENMINILYLFQDVTSLNTKSNKMVIRKLKRSKSY